MGQSKFLSKHVAGVLVALFFGVGLYLRIAFPYDTVFSEHGIKLTGIDAYYFMRYVDNFVHNFPHLITFDPYMNYPHGQPFGGFTFFIYLLGGITWLMGLGSPTQHTVDVVGAYFPAIVGALIVIPVYFIGRALFNRWAGVIAAGLIALMSGEFLGRTLLGRADRDALQVLLAALTMLFLILAVKTASQSQLTFHHLRRLDWEVIAKPLFHSFLAGVFLGVYILTWRGAFISVFVIFAYFVVQFIIDHLRGKSTDYLAITGTVPFLVALAMFSPVFQSQLYLAPLIIALMTPWLLTAVSRLMSRKGIRPACFPLALLGLGLAGLALFYIVSPAALKSMLASLGSVFASSALLVSEMEPILFPHGEFSLSVVWNNFTTGLFLSLIALSILTYRVIRRGEADKTAFLVWSVVALGLTFAQRRFALHFALNVALLAGYFSWLVLEYYGFKEAAKPMEVLKRVKKNVKKRTVQKGSRRTYIRTEMAVGVILVFLLTFLPNIFSAKAETGHLPPAPSDAWCESLSWLRDNTADPFGDPDFYYSLYSTPFKYSETAYGVAAWWDYGYWVVRIGRRLPVCDPGGGAREMVARFFTSQDEASANKILSELKSKYVIIDRTTITTKFYAMAIYAGSTKENFFDVYYEREGSRLTPWIFYHPDYYRSLAVRLYNFDGEQVNPERAIVVSYEEKVDRTGVCYKEITDIQTFSSYEEVAAYVAKQTSGTYKIVSPTPFDSPVPLEALKHYRLVYSSDASVLGYGDKMIPEVKIFEYTE
ncbi:MAG: oligosaccharyl transferase, archaeosortase A system-associated [Chloroflexota bacterium]